ncbi:hypothetical protein [Halovivax sp.]|nr:hypothetical protein [Halovivax sp.]
MGDDEAVGEAANGVSRLGMASGEHSDPRASDYVSRLGMASGHRREP